MCETEGKLARGGPPMALFVYESGAPNRVSAGSSAHAARHLRPGARSLQIHQSASACNWTECLSFAIWIHTRCKARAFPEAHFSTTELWRCHSGHTVLASPYALRGFAMKQPICSSLGQPRYSNTEQPHILNVETEYIQCGGLVPSPSLQAPARR